MNPPSKPDPTLLHLRAQFAAGDIEGTRRAVQQLSPEGRRQLAARIGADNLARIMAASRQTRRGVEGRVVVINGIMGAKLDTIDSAGREENVWVNLPLLNQGRIQDFAFDANGDPADPSLRVVAQALMEDYLGLVLHLRQGWEVLQFPFDWRLDMDKSADDLNDKIRAFAGGEPAHIVAHSMGGLVSRRFIQRHRDTWQSMKDPSGMRQGGRLVMLGTPNRGSFAITLVLTGEEGTVKLLEKWDWRHDMPELLQIIDTFPGSYQMMPSPKLAFGDDRAQLYDEATWGRLPVLQANLDRGRRFQEVLHDVDDPDRLIYVAGYDQATPYRIRVDAPGRFSYQETLAGDGRVPHELGMLPGVPTFYVREKHGNLPSNQEVLAGIDDLLRSGTTDALDSRRTLDRAAPTTGAWRKASEIVPPPPPIAVPGTRGRAAINRLSVEQQAAIEAAILEPFVGARRAHAVALPDAGEAKPATKAPAKKRAPALKLGVVWGDITQVDGDVFTTGHYQGVEPQAGELALDKVASGIAHGEAYDAARLVITSHTRRGILRGAVGDINFFPWPKSRKTIAIAGMGYPGTFGRPELRRLARNLAESVSTLPDVRTVNMLLIGSGVGNLRPAVALSALIDGLIDALGEGTRSSSIKRIQIVEWDWKRAQEIGRALVVLSADASLAARAGLAMNGPVATGRGGHFGDEIALSAVLAALAKRGHAKGDRAGRRIVGEVLRSVPAAANLRRRSEQALDKLARLPGRDILGMADALNLTRARDDDGSPVTPARLSFMRDPAGLRAAAISESAVVTERTVAVNWALVEDLIERLTDPDDVTTIPDLSALMARLVIPRDFRAIIGANTSFVFELDRDTARIQWEMVGKFNDAATAMQPQALAGPLARQLRTSYSPPPSRAVSSAGPLRALVVGDPGDPDRGYSLDGARQEALEVARLLTARNVQVDVLIGAENAPRKGDLVGIEPATIVEVLRLLNKNAYDLMHFSGHGNFDPQDPEKRAGWVFGTEYFTARELTSVDQAPALIVANACLSGLTSNRRASTKASRLRGTDDTLLPALVDEFFMRGVRNYIGTAWSVSDVGAVMFATTFYDALVADAGGGGGNASIGDAMFKARTTLKQHEESFGALWAAYQHYGDPTLTLRGAQPHGVRSRTTRPARRTAIDATPSPQPRAARPPRRR